MSISKKKPSLSLEIKITEPVLRNRQLNEINGRVKSTKILLNNSDQVILSKTHAISKLIISHYHKLTLHSGRGQTLASEKSSGYLLAVD